MSRKPRYKIKEVQPDKVYKSKLVGKFINKVMLSGKKTIAESLVYESLIILGEETKTPAIEAFNTAIENIIPKMEVKSRRVGGSTYQVPVEVEKHRGYSLAIRWIIHFARQKKGVSFPKALSSELIDAFNKTGASAKKKEDTYKMAEANKAFAHFRW